MLENKLQASFILTAILYLASLSLTPYTGQFLIKVFPILILLSCSLILLPNKPKYWISVALIASGIGDVMLALPLDNSFIWGLGAFFVAQVIYAISFFFFKKQRALSKVNLAIVLMLLVYSVSMAIYVLPHTGELLLPVAAYLSVITLMGISALRSSLNWKVSVGALLFISSDSALALSVFKTPLPLSSYIVMTTYYLAQYFIVFGMIDSSKK